MISPQWISETRLGLAYHDAGSYPTDPYGPSIDINGFGFFGRDFILPGRVVERAWQLRQNFTLVSGRHIFKFGADINPVRDSARVETFFSGRFIFGEAVPLANLIDRAAAPVLRNFSRLCCLAPVLPNSQQRSMNPSLPCSPMRSACRSSISRDSATPTGRAGRIATASLLRTRGAWRRTSWLTLGGRHEFELKTGFPRDNNNFSPG